MAHFDKSIPQAEVRALCALCRRSDGGPQALVDVGCGTGKVLRVAAELGYTVRGIEVDETARAATADLDVFWGTFAEALRSGWTAPALPTVGYMYDGGVFRVEEINNVAELAARFPEGSLMVFVTAMLPSDPGWAALQREDYADVVVITKAMRKRGYKRLGFVHDLHEESDSGEPQQQAVLFARDPKHFAGAPLRKEPQTEPSE